MTTPRNLTNLMWAAMLALASLTICPVTAQQAPPKPVALEGPAGDAIKALCSEISDLASFEMELTFAGVNRQDQIRQSFLETYRIVVAKPNRLALIPTKGFFGPTVVSDGQFLWIYLPTLHEYTKEPVPADFDTLLNKDPRVTQIVASITPLGPTLLSAEPCKSLMDGVEGIDYLEQADSNNTLAEKIALRQGPLTWQLSISQGDQRLPLLMSLDLTELLKQREDFAKDFPFEVSRTWQMSTWRTPAPLNDDTFSFTPPAGAREVKQFSQTPESQPHHPLLDQDAPAFTLKTLDGKAISLADHHHKNIVILDFWATWCKPCRDALPAMSSVARQFKKHGVVFYAVNLGQSAADVRSFLDGNQLDVTVLLTGTDRKLSQDYGVKGIPQTVVIGKDGKVRQVHVGFTPETPAQLQAELNALINGGFDLTCKETSLAGGSVTVDKPLPFTCVIANKGPHPVRAGQYSVVLSVDDQEVFAGPGHADIPVDEQISYSANPDVWQLSILKPGTYNYVIEIVPHTPCAESNPQDNVLTGQLEVGESK